MKATKPELGELERAVMGILWSHKALSAEAVREKLGRPLKEATIRTVLRRLEDKGYLTHQVENRTFMYAAAESRQRVATRAVKRIVVLVGMVDAEMVDKAQLNRLLATVEEAEQRAKKRTGRTKKGGSDVADDS
jgi:BlaI family transcriptional regulator, penicillinase repressor